MNKESIDVDDKVSDEIYLTQHILVKKQREIISMTVQKL